MSIKNAEQQRLDNQNTENWRLWGPYLAERAWGSVREDYSSNGTAWEYFSHDQARSRAYRWNEDGLGGICDEQQNLCFALALWNGKDAILKERAFGLTGNQGNHGEDVKEYYFYDDALPSHTYLKYLYKYPQAAFPYNQLVQENGKRGRDLPPFSLLDTGVFNDNRYWDVEVEYAKATIDEIHIRITANNRGCEEAMLHLLPSLWFRNTWSWDSQSELDKPFLAKTAQNDQCWTVKATQLTLGNYYLYGKHPADLLFTENNSNSECLWGLKNEKPYVKDSFHRRIIANDSDAVNPNRVGTKFAAWYQLTVPAGEAKTIELVLTAKESTDPFTLTDSLFEQRRSEANVFYETLLPDGDADDKRLFRQAIAGMIWSKQFFHFDVLRWLQGDGMPPPENRKNGRNAHWKHLRAGDVILMPDTWEYPWFAAWDLAFHCMAFSLIDVDFAKNQIELLLRETYLHPNGQIPAYEWAFGDVNPPVHALAALQVFRTERQQRGQGDRNFLQRVFHKLLMNYTWWINNKDSDGLNVFEGGFLGLDNISVFDRSMRLPDGYKLKQSDATGWMAMFALNMTVMALELAVQDPDYEDTAIQTYEQFLNIANSVAGHTGTGLPLWDESDGFFKDLLVEPNGTHHRVDVYSWVGIIPLFACEVIDQRLLEHVPRFRKLLDSHRGGAFHGNFICACPAHESDRGEQLLSLVDHTMLPAIVRRLFDENEFLSPHGIRSVSRIHAERRDLGFLPGIGKEFIEYVPGESNSGLFGGNSNWRGPIWLPTNYVLILALEKFSRFLGDGFTVAASGLAKEKLTLREVVDCLARRMTDLYRPNCSGKLPVFPPDSPWQSDPLWREHLQFYEYFHGDNGLGLGAAHQTGWTGLLANLVMRCHGIDIAGFEIGAEGNAKG